MSIKPDIEDLKLMYPHLDEESINNKLKLYLNFIFFFPYINDSINAKVIVQLKNKSHLEIPTYKVRQPYPNKAYYKLSMRNKQRISKRGIVLLFDDFEELSNIENIICVWEYTENDKKGVFTVAYTPHFVQNTYSENTYCLISKVTPIKQYELMKENSNGMAEYFQEHDIMWTPFKEHYISSMDTSMAETLFNKGIEIWFHNDINSIYSDECSVNCYFSEIEIQPTSSSPLQIRY